MVSEAEVRAALEAVNDPHIPVSLRRMGMLRGVSVGEDGTVRVALCIPCLACPGVSLIRADIRQALLRLPGVRSVEIADGWHASWSPEMIDGEARELMRGRGIQV